jgi:hypothetical protein
VNEDTNLPHMPAKPRTVCKTARWPPAGVSLAGFAAGKFAGAGQNLHTARQNGHQISDRGRMPKTVVDAFQAAH